MVMTHISASILNWAMPQQKNKKKLHAEWSLNEVISGFVLAGVLIVTGFI